MQRNMSIMSASRHSITRLGGTFTHHRRLAVSTTGISGGDGRLLCRRLAQQLAAYSPIPIATICAAAQCLSLVVLPQHRSAPGGERKKRICRKAFWAYLQPCGDSQPA
jgi:hypothetical protein